MKEGFSILNGSTKGDTTARAAVATLASLALLVTIFMSLESAWADSRLSGIVLATDSCQLIPPGVAEVCQPAVISIKGIVALEKMGAVKSTRIVRLSDNGTFTQMVPDGTYKLRLLRVKARGKRLARGQYRVSPGTFSVTEATGSVYFFVYHRDRAQPVAARVGDGCVAD